MSIPAMLFRSSIDICGEVPMPPMRNELAGALFGIRANSNSATDFTGSEDAPPSTVGKRRRLGDRREIAQGVVRAPALYTDRIDRESVAAQDRVPVGGRFGGELDAYHLAGARGGCRRRTAAASDSESFCARGGR